MPDYLHGVRVLEVNEGTRPIRTVSTAVIGFIATADDADTDTFPENEAVFITRIFDVIGKAGTSGTLKHVLDAIGDHTNAFTVVVRVPEGADEQATEANVMAGIPKLLTAKVKFDVTPRILGAPGLDSQAVTAELVTTAQKLGGFVYARGQGDTKEAVANYRNNFGQRELMLIWPDFTGFDVAKKAQGELLATARALGLRAKIDQDIGWHKTLSNVQVNGVTGTSEDVFFELTSESTDANYLNSKEVTTIIRDGGFQFWGSRTTSAEPLFAFENYVRTAQVLKDTIAYAHKWAMDKPMSAGLVSDILSGINAKFKELVTAGYLIGAEAYYDEADNLKEQLKDGQLKIRYNYTPVPPLEQLTFVQQITDEYLIDFAAQING